MKEYKASSIRNVAILGHLGSGKTSLAESFLFITKKIEKKGEVERKNTVSDYLPEEQARLTSLTSALIPVEFKDIKINFLDTPGSEEFIGELENVLSVVSGAVLLVDPTKGVEVGTERAWEELRKRNLPTIIMINKMDKENVKYDETIQSIKEKLGQKAVSFAFPIGVSADFKGYANIVDKNAIIGDTITTIPQDIANKMDDIYHSLIEASAESDEELLEKYLLEEELTSDEMRKGLKIGISSGEIYPILVGAGLKNIGVNTLLDMILDYIPAPSDAAPAEGYIPKTDKKISRAPSDDAPVSGYVFKTIFDPFVGTINFIKLYSGTLKSGQEVYLTKTETVTKVAQLFTMMGKTQIPVDIIHAGDIAAVAKVNDFSNGTTFCDKKDPIVFPVVEHPTPVIFVAITPRNKQDEDKISSSLQKLRLEDETFEIVRNPETAQLLIGGQGMTHLGYIFEKMHNMFKVDIDVHEQKIVYRETIRSKGQAQGRHKKQSGGAGQFGDVWVRFEPSEKDFEFAEEVFGGSVPKNYFPAVEKGLIETLEHGPLAGFPVIGIKAVLYDGSYHPVDSNELSFKLAASLAFKAALPMIKPTILEPIMEVKVIVKDTYIGDIMGDMTKRRGRVLGMEQKNGMQELLAEVPEAEITKYAVDLKAMTQGGGRFSRKFLRYEEVPENLIAKIIEEYKK